MAENETKLTQESLRNISLFEQVTGTEVKDCVDEEERLTFLVDHEKLGKAIGRNAKNLRTLQERTGKDVEVVGFHEDPEQFVRNLFHKVTIEDLEFVENEEGEEVAQVTINEEEKGRAIGKGGRNVDLYRLLAERHADLGDIKVL